MRVLCLQCGGDLKINKIIYVDISVGKSGSYRKIVNIMCTVCGRKIPIDKLNDSILKELNLGDDVWDI